MDAVFEALPMALFLVLGTVMVASSILVVAMRNPVHSALFLLLTFLCVAILFILAQAEFVGAVQLLVYAGGIMVLFLFVVMLANVRDIPHERMLSPYWLAGIGVGIALLLVFATILQDGGFAVPAPTTEALRSTGAQAVVVGNTEAIGIALYRDYLVPFEVASLFLLVAMVGAIVIGKRRLGATAEEAVPDFIVRRVAEEKREKEAMGA
ncbi:MAG: NADH-quinone oxidoreductase subunit J family protein [Thermoanaerobaculia bacterium]